MSDREATFTNDELDRMYNEADCGALNPGRGTLMDLIQQAKSRLVPAGSEVGPQWCAKPTCFGRWISSGGIDRFFDRHSDIEALASICDRWYGPIPKCDLKLKGG